MTAPLEVRPLDIVVFGATGFTGRLIAEYLAEHYGSRGVRWGIAGRSRDRLEALRHELAKKDNTLANLPIYVADAGNVAGLDALVTKARVVATTVGPYAKYGIELARACARHGTSYCDLAGEPHFIRSVIDDCHVLAQASGARIVPASGFDSVPSDLGVHLAWDHARRNHGEGLAWVKIFVGRMTNTASGGTVASMFGVVEAATQSSDVRSLLLTPHGLDPHPDPTTCDPFENDQRGVRFDHDLGEWTSPFLMAPVNTRVVRRSHALLRLEGAGYGPHFRYHEAKSFQRGPRGLVMASAMTAGIGALYAAAMNAPVRSLLERVALPSPGEGPSPEVMDSGYFEMHIRAATESGRRIVGRIAGTKDGYGETAKMFSETAICLATDSARLRPCFGVLTPATAMGMVLVERLRAAGMDFEVEDAAPPHRGSSARAAAHALKRRLASLRPRQAKSGRTAIAWIARENI